MSPTRFWLAVLREAMATARSQPVVTLLSIAIVAGMCSAVLLTSGRTVGAEQQVIASIDDAGTRSIVVRAEESAGLDSSVVERLSRVTGIEWAAAFGPAVDVTNSASVGVKTALRKVWTLDPAYLGMKDARNAAVPTAWADRQSLVALGLAEKVGTADAGGGTFFTVVGGLRNSDALQSLGPLLLAPQPIHDVGPVATIVVVAKRPQLVASVTAAVASVLGAVDASAVKITTSQNLASLRALVQGQLGAFGRNLVAVIFGFSAVLEAAILYGLVTLRRKDFGRRRALGASQRLIVILVLAQVGVVSVVGTTIGTAVAAIILAVGRDPLPPFSYVLAIAFLAVLVATVAAILPALVAARREPIRELRVP